MASVFGISSTDVQNKLNPDADENRFSIGTSGDISDAACLTIIEEQEKRLLSSLPDRYRRLVTGVDGEILSASADGTTTDYTVSFYPASNLKVYIDYPEVVKSWELRNVDDVESDSNYSFVEASGVLTFTTAPSEGSTIYVEYDHAAASGMSYLKDLATNMTAVEISRRFSYFRSADDFDRFSQWEQNLIMDLQRLRKGEMGITELDDIELVKDETNKNMMRGIYDTFLRL